MSLLGNSIRDFNRVDKIAYDINKKDVFYRFSYNEDSKFLTKTLNMECKIIISDITFNNDFNAKISFKGQTKIINALFDIKGSDETIDNTLNDSKLIDTIINTTTKVDIAKILVSYYARPKTLEIKIYPYAGALIWIKVPPIYFPLKFYGDEMNELYNLMKKIGGFFVRNKTMLK